VKGIVWDEVEALQEGFVDDLDKSWTNSTQSIVAIGVGKKMALDHEGVTSPYMDQAECLKAFWTTIFAGQKMPDTKVFDWLPEKPPEWQYGKPPLAVLDADRLEKLEMVLATHKIFKKEDSSAKLQVIISGTTFNQTTPVDPEWTDSEKTAYASQFEELAELWQSQPYDLYHRPFELSFIIPDPF
jgi:hypothetical protein